MGDLALCQEWIGDLGREECRFAFAVSSNLTKFIDKADTCFEFQPWIDVGDTFLLAAAIFRPDAVILASNSFWGMKNQCGAQCGQFPEQLYRLGVPLLSFDSFEMGFSTRVPHANQSIRVRACPSRGVEHARYVAIMYGAEGPSFLYARGLRQGTRRLQGADAAQVGSRSREEDGGLSRIREPISIDHEVIPALLLAPGPVVCFYGV